MFGSVMLDVLIGLVLVYLLLSLMCSAAREVVAGMTRARATMLVAGIKELLRNDTVLIRAFFEHPQIWSLYRGDYDTASRTKALPSYIPSRSFAMALLDIAARGRDASSSVQSSPEASVLSLQNVRRNIGNLGNPFVQRVVLSALDGADGTLERACTGVELWFNSAMDRVSGRYKKETQRLLFVIGLVLTVALDVNTLAIARQLYRDPARREAAVALATATAKEGAPRPATDSLARRSLQRLDSLGLPEAWAGVTVTGIWPDPGEWKAIRAHAASAWFGWLITAFAISFGAPFWFDALGKLIAIRSTVKPKETPPAGASAATPPPAPTAPVNTAAIPVAPRAAADGSVSHQWATGRPDGGIL
jgi:hypothetical protein